MTEMKRTTVFLMSKDEVAIEIIKERYGVSSVSDAIRLALRMVANELDERRGKQIADEVKAEGD